MMKLHTRYENKDGAQALHTIPSYDKPLKYNNILAEPLIHFYKEERK